MRPVLNLSQLKQLDKEVCRTQGISSWDLMKRVAHDMAQVYLSEISENEDCIVLCGPGNNGGDGYCFAEFLRQNSRSVKVLEVYPAQSEEAKKAQAFCRAPRIEQLPDEKYVAVDAVFGISGRDVLEDSLCRILRRAQSRASIRISLDVPTGLNVETGVFHPEGFVSDFCYSVAVVKESFLRKEVLERLGQIRWIDGDFGNLPDTELQLIEERDFSIERQRSRHKTGRCLVFAGSSKSPGAAFLAAEAAQRVGCGFVRLYFADKDSPPIELKQASFQYHPRWTWSEIEEADSLCVGPGGYPEDFWVMGNFPASIPRVMDADALDQIRVASGESLQILTPHPGEAARLLSVDVREVLEAPLESARALSRLSKSVVYLKSQPAFLVFPDSKTSYVNLSLQPALGTAGSGDVLSGIMAGLLAQSPQERASSALISAVAFHISLAEVLEDFPAALSSDQLGLFSEAFKRLGRCRPPGLR